MRQLQKNLVKQADAAQAHADNLLCQEWNARQFIGGPAAPSPTIAEAINGECVLLRVQCRRCAHTRQIDLTKIRRPRDQRIHTLENNLSCDACDAGGLRWRASKPNLIELCMREPGPTNVRRNEAG